MRKNLKGKEYGKGVYQRKDGLYSARFVNGQGKRQEKCFTVVQEARNWLEKAKYEDKHSNVITKPIRAINDNKFLTIEKQESF